jgi:hypothetical protein
MTVTEGGMSLHLSKVAHLPRNMVARKAPLHHAGILQTTRTPRQAVLSNGFFLAVAACYSRDGCFCRRLVFLLITGRKE